MTRLSRHHKDKKVSRMNLASMMDVLTVLVFFLRR